GNSWDWIGEGTNQIVPHTDHHAWAFLDGAVYNGNDGGIWRFNPLPGHQQGPSTWDNLNTLGLQTNLLMGMALHPTDPESALEGSQDNGTALRTVDGGNVWDSIAGGDGGFPRFDPLNPLTLYVETTGSDFYRSDDGGVNFASKRSGLSSDGTFPF